jgi:hypothetical protein
MSLADFPPEQTSFLRFLDTTENVFERCPFTARSRGESSHCRFVRAPHSLPVPAPAPLHSFVGVQAPSGPITLFIQLPGSTEGMDFAGRFVYQIKDATIAKFKLDAAPQQLRLFKLGNGGRHIQLDPTQTLTDVGVVTGTTLVLEPVASAVLASM